MKKGLKFIFSILGVCFILAGCSTNTHSEGTLSPSPETSSNATTTVTSNSEAAVSNKGQEAASADSNQIETSQPQKEYTVDSIGDLPTYSYRDLFEYYYRADGAYSEGSMSEIIYRFTVDPDSLLSALAEMDNEIQLRIADELGLSMKSWEYSDYRNESSLREAESHGLDEQQRALLDIIIESYNNTTY